MNSPSGRNWKVLIVKRRVWPWGEDVWGSDTTACWGAGSKGLGHLGSNSESVRMWRKKIIFGFPYSHYLYNKQHICAVTPLCLTCYWRSLAEEMHQHTRCKAAPTQLLQSGGRPHKSAPAAPNWDLESWAGALPGRGVSPGASAGAGDTEGSSCYTQHLDKRKRILLTRDYNSKFNSLKTMQNISNS